jgi:hypothetical protein
MYDKLGTYGKEQFLVTVCNGNILYECDELSIVFNNQFHQIYEYSIEIISYNVSLINGLLY